MRINQYLQPSTLDEAAAFVKEPDTAVLGGGAWIRLNSKTVERAVDISPLGLNTIERKNDELILGAMVTLRQIETDPQLNELWNRVIPRSIEHIVGVQMRDGSAVFVLDGDAALGHDIDTFEPVAQRIDGLAGRDRAGAQRRDQRIARAVGKLVIGMEMSKDAGG